MHTFTKKEMFAYLLLPPQLKSQIEDLNRLTVTEVLERVHNRGPNMAAQR